MREIVENASSDGNPQNHSWFLSSLLAKVEPSWHELVPIDWFKNCLITA